MNGSLILGNPGATTVAEDYDGDGKADPAVYRQSDGLWACALSASGYTMQTLAFGGPNYQPAK